MYGFGWRIGLPRLSRLLVPCLLLVLFAVIPPLKVDAARGDGQSCATFQSTERNGYSANTLGARVWGGWDGKNFEYVVNANSTGTPGLTLCADRDVIWTFADDYISNPVSTAVPTVPAGTSTPTSVPWAGQSYRYVRWGAVSRDGAPFSIVDAWVNTGTTQGGGTLGQCPAAGSFLANSSNTCGVVTINRFVINDQPSNMYAIFGGITCGNNLDPGTNGCSITASEGTGLSLFRGTATPGSSVPLASGNAMVALATEFACAWGDYSYLDQASVQTYTPGCGAVGAGYDLARLADDTLVVKTNSKLQLTALAGVNGGTNSVATAVASQTYSVLVKLSGIDSSLVGLDSQGFSQPYLKMIGTVVAGKAGWQSDAGVINAVSTLTGKYVAPVAQYTQVAGWQSDAGVISAVSTLTGKYQAPVAQYTQIASDTGVLNAVSTLTGKYVAPVAQYTQIATDTGVTSAVGTAVASQTFRLLASESAMLSSLGDINAGIQALSVSSGSTSWIGDFWGSAVSQVTVRDAYSDYQTGLVKAAVETKMAPVLGLLADVTYIGDHVSYTCGSYDPNSVVLHLPSNFGGGTIPLFPAWLIDMWCPWRELWGRVIVLLLTLTFVPRFLRLFATGGPLMLSGRWLGAVRVRRRRSRTGLAVAGGRRRNGCGWHPRGNSRVAVRHFRAVVLHDRSDDLVASVVALAAGDY